MKKMFFIRNLLSQNAESPRTMPGLRTVVRRGIDKPGVYLLRIIPCEVMDKVYRSKPIWFSYTGVFIILVPKRWIRHDIPRDPFIIRLIAQDVFVIIPLPDISRLHLLPSLACDGTLIRADYGGNRSGHRPSKAFKILGIITRSDTIYPRWGTIYRAPTSLIIQKYNAVHVVGHENKYIEENVWEMLREPFPAFLCNIPNG
jgi:hypothetical protein